MEPDEPYYEDEDEFTDEEAVAGLLTHAQDKGMDVERVVGFTERLVAGGADPVNALAYSVDSHDLSEAGDEMEALAKISAREGWR